MYHWLLLVRFFRIVPPVPLLVTVFSGAALVTAAGLALVAPYATAAPLPTLLVLQIFAASSGAIGPARRGYYDALLSRGVGRAQLLWGHWMASLAPGTISWLVVAVLESLSTGAGGTSALSSGSLVALWLASSLPWAGTVALPRFAAAITWLVVLVATLTTIPAGQSRLVATLDGGDATAWAPLAAVVYPMGLIGRSLTTDQWVVVAPALLLSIVAPAAALAWFCRTDIPLEASQ